MRDVGGDLPSRYSYGSSISDTRDWFDCHMSVDASGNGVCSGLDPYGSNHDDIAQDWEIGPRSSATFGVPTSPARNPDLTNFPREYNRIWTVGVQQEVFPGLSVSAEYRQRTYHNTFAEDNRSHSFASFGALPDGTPDPGVRRHRPLRPGRAAVSPRGVGHPLQHRSCRADGRGPLGRGKRRGDTRTSTAASS